MKNNGQVWKVIGTLVGSGILVTMATMIWQASTIASRVNTNCDIIQEIKHEEIPRIEKNKDDIIGMKKDIAQILANIEKMEQTESENTQAIISEIRRINGD